MSHEASDAQVEAALDVLGCGAYQNRRGVVVCVNEHHEHHGPWTERGCPVAAAVADAVVAAGPDADEVERLRADLALYKRGGKTLGETIDWQCRAVLDATGMHHLIDEDGDGDWALVWEHLAELRPRAEAAEAEVERLRDDLLYAAQQAADAKATVARVEALAETMANEHGQSWNSITARRIRTHLSGPTSAETPQNGPEPALSREQGTSGQSGEGEALRGAEKRCGACAAGWFGSRWHNPPFSCHYHCECGTPCRACAVGDGFHRSSPHKPAEHDACGCGEADR